MFYSIEVDVKDIEVNIDNLLDQENIHNKTESWNKLNKTLKIQKLHHFSEKYGKEHKYSVKEIKLLKHFFTDSLDKKKLQKAKEVMYDKYTQEITEIPGLYYHAINKAFTIRADVKRQSTLKSLTPKRFTEKLNVEEDKEYSKEI